MLLLSVKCDSLVESVLDVFCSVLNSILSVIESVLYILSCLVGIDLDVLGRILILILV